MLQKRQHVHTTTNPLTQECLNGQVVEGEAATSKVSHWISKNYGGKMHIEVRSVAEESGSATAVAQFKDDLKAESFIVLSGDLLTDVPLKVTSATPEHTIHSDYVLCRHRYCSREQILHHLLYRLWQHPTTSQKQQ